MLSQKLKTLSRHLRDRSGRHGGRYGGVYLAPDEVAIVNTILLALAEQVAALERQPVPAACRDALPPGVVDLLAHRARTERTVGRGLPDGCRPDGGLAG